MNNLKGKDLTSIEGLDAADARAIFDTAKLMEPFAFRQKLTRVLEGAVLANLFFEPSTRTRISFGTAFNRLGGEVRDTSGTETTSITKGESLYDTARVVGGYADVITVRHPKTGAAKEVADAVDVPVINGGDGVGEHPTQALLDVYTIEARLGKPNGKTIAIVGDLKFARVIHSFARLLSKMYQGINFKFIAPNGLQMPENVRESIRTSGSQHTMTDHDSINAISDADVIYITRTQEERFADPAEYERYKGKLRIDKKTLDTLGKPGVMLLHPMPRDSREGSNELDHDLDGDPRLAMFNQTDNGIPVRMAIFALVLDVADQIEKTARPVNWHVPKKP
ncbi:aspartate carbamoyltransferase [Candidatus Peribacteria bacterium]|nr:aspartate carbamoyltransferase [Candidatus Peribacteria bacterium]